MVRNSLLFLALALVGCQTTQELADNAAVAADIAINPTCRSIVYTRVDGRIDYQRIDGTGSYCEDMRSSTPR